MSTDVGLIIGGAVVRQPVWAWDGPVCPECEGPAEVVGDRLVCGPHGPGHYDEDWAAVWADHHQPDPMPEASIPHEVVTVCPFCREAVSPRSERVKVPASGDYFHGACWRLEHDIEPADFAHDAYETAAGREVYGR